MRYFYLIGLFIITLFSKNATANPSFVPKKLPVTHISDKAHILISGTISPGDDIEIAKLIHKNESELGKNPLILLNSSGGDVDTALFMGRILRKNLAWTVLKESGTCNSSCIFVMMGGVTRTILGDAGIGMHRPRFNQKSFSDTSNSGEAIKKYNSLRERLKEYFDDMGIPQEVLEKMMSIPSKDIVYKNHEYAAEVGLTGKDAAYAEWSRASDIKRLRKAYVEARDDLLQCYNSGSTEIACDQKFREKLGRLK